MNAINNVIDMRTPIEVALNIDSEGMTTARKLYDFLGLAQGQFSRWAKTNITDNEFATENEDYWGFDIDVEGNKAVDYKLTAHFAKKLSVKGNSEKAEQAREYFTTVEERVKQKAIDISQLSPELKMFNTIFQSVAQQQLEQKMYYSEPIAPHVSESNYDRAKRHYTETKEMHKGASTEDKEHKMKALDMYIRELSGDISELLNDMTPDERNLLRTKMSNLASKL